MSPMKDSRMNQNSEVAGLKTKKQAAERRFKKLGWLSFVGLSLYDASTARSASNYDALPTHRASVLHMKGKLAIIHTQTLCFLEVCNAVFPGPVLMDRMLHVWNEMRKKNKVTIGDSGGCFLLYFWTNAVSTLLPVFFFFFSFLVQDGSNFAEP